mmetsp:Transcript_13565/g.54839  ORF Transcript_13565/g.54839 Transcript_13565/m.54839 type:complete len:298 (-) Transcript_13565:65-958(-)
MLRHPVLDASTLAAISSRGLPSDVLPPRLYTLTAVREPFRSVAAYTAPDAPEPSGGSSSSTPSSDQSTTGTSTRFSFSFDVSFDAPSNDTFRVARALASSDQPSVAGFAASATHARLGCDAIHSGTLARLLSASRMSSSLVMCLAMLSGRPALVSLFPASRSLRMFSHLPTVSGSERMLLSLRMSHPRVRYGMEAAGTSSTLFALNDSMYSDFISPSTSGTLVNSHPRKKRIFRLVRPAKVDGRVLSGFFPRLRNSKVDNVPISSGSAEMPRPERSRRVRPVAARDPDVITAKMRSR